jgi:plastocyanin
MRTLFVALAGFVLMGTAAPPPQTATPNVVEVRLQNYEFTPSTVRLAVGQEQVLRLIDVHGSHSFSAPELFAASRIDPASADRVRDGKVELREGDTVEIRLTPLTAGTYTVHCTHMFHSASGMRGQAIVG